MIKRITTPVSAVAAILGIWLCGPMARAADYPAWWLSRQVVNTNAMVTNDFAAANLGQLKWFATNAYDELQAELTGGAGTNIANMVTGFASSNNYVAVNVGQVKYVAAPFYDRLISAGVTNAYPWTTNTIDDADYAGVNIGQLKHIFTFEIESGGGGDSDGDGLLDAVESGTGVFVSPDDTGSSANLVDTDGDGTDDGTEVDNRTDPNSSDTNTPTVVIALPTGDFIWVVIP